MKQEIFQKWKQALTRYRTVILVLAAGIVLMLLPSGEEDISLHLQGQVSQQQEEFDLGAFETKLSQMLSQVAGAGETKVLLTLKSSSRKVLAQDMEQDGERVTTSMVTVGRASSGQDVVELQTLFPQFQGAIIVCPGGDDPAVRLALSRAVASATGLGSDRISICKST